jgi:hypothetical protein
MDLPLWFSTSPLFGSLFERCEMGACMPLKPFQLFQLLMSLFFQSVLVDPLPAPAVLRPTCLRDRPEAEDNFWIESLSQWLTETWVDAGVVMDEALKADDAKIHTGLWDQQVVLVLPDIVVQDLELLCPRFYFAWCQKLTECYEPFVPHTHGFGWEEHLFKLRCLRCLGAASERGPHQWGNTASNSERLILKGW